MFGVPRINDVCQNFCPWQRKADVCHISSVGSLLPFFNILSHKVLSDCSGGYALHPSARSIALAIGQIGARNRKGLRKMNYPERTKSQELKTPIAAFPVTHRHLLLFVGRCHSISYSAFLIPVATQTRCHTRPTGRKDTATAVETTTL